METYANPEQGIVEILCVETLHGTSHEEEEKVQTTMAKATR